MVNVVIEHSCYSGINIMHITLSLRAGRDKLVHIIAEMKKSMTITR